MQLVYLTFVLRNEKALGMEMHRYIIRVLTNKVFPIVKLKTLQQQIKGIGTSLDSLEYMEFWKGEFKYLIPECCKNNFCLIVSEGNNTLLAGPIGWEVKEISSTEGIVESWPYIVPVNWLARDYINVLTVRHYEQPTTSTI